MKTLSKISFVSTITLLLSACGGSSKAPHVPPVEPPDITAPIIVDIVDQQILADESSDEISISVSDNKTAADQLMISVVSSNQAVVTDQQLLLSGQGANLSLVITPIADTIGSTDIMITAIDEANNSAMQTFVVSVLAKPVSARSFVNEVLTFGADQDAVLINGIELIQDIDTENEFDYLLEE